MQFIPLLLSIAIIVIQGILGLADWSILCGNWVLAGLVILGIIFAFDHERITGFNNGALFQKVWVTLASMMNLNAIYLQEEMVWWKLDLLAIGLASLISVGIGCWQSTNKPTRSMLFGLIIAIMSSIYAPMLISILIIFLVFIYLSSYSTRNMVSLLSGIIFSSWIIYCITALCFGNEAEGTLVQNFIEGWKLKYTLPHFKFEGYTGIVFVAMSAMFFVIYALGGFIADNATSLRIRSNIAIQSILCLLFTLMMPTCWPLYLMFGSITLCVHLIFALNERPTKFTIRCAQFVMACYMIAGVGEPLFRIAWDYFMSE